MQIKEENMLKEKVFFDYQNPVKMTVMEIEEYPIHFHDEIEVVYVIEGEINLKNGNCEYLLEKDDVFILNAKEIHSYYCTNKKNKVAILQIDFRYYEDENNPLENSFFITDMKDKNNKKLEALKETFISILFEKIEERPGYEKRMIEMTDDFLKTLAEHFQYFSIEDGKFINKVNSNRSQVQSERLKRIIDYMYGNYNRKLTLTEISQKEHLSLYYLSHLMKASVGMSFQELLNFIRVEESEKLLLDTDEKISIIAEECGFSSTRYYLKYFSIWFDHNPTEHRNLFKDKVHSRTSRGRFRMLERDELVDSFIKNSFFGLEMEGFNKLKKQIRINCNQNNSMLESTELIGNHVSENPEKTMLEAIKYMEDKKEGMQGCDPPFMALEDKTSNKDFTVVRTPLEYATDFFSEIKGDRIKAEPNCLVYNARQTYWIACWWYKKEEQEIISEMEITLAPINGAYKVVKEYLKLEDSVFLHQLSSKVMDTNTTLNLREELVSPAIHLIRLYKI